ncbi:MAG TPA: DUF3095 family protein [Nitrosomonas nitrosa]|nr:DUF3095 family protein [Nitrosomonas nitrosa]
METPATSEFVASLPVLKTFSDALPQDNYVSLPDNWLVAVTDVVGSRKAIAKGKFKAVNMAGVAMITAIMNALGHHKIPYIFGGDGAAVAFAPDADVVIRKALAQTSTWVADELSLELRSAIVPVKAIHEQGSDVRVAGLYVSEAITNYAFSGGGIGVAEKLMKQGDYTVEGSISGDYPDLSGLSCRWMPVEKKGSKIISMIVEAAEGRDEVPESIMQELLTVVRADEPGSHPAPENQLKFRWPPQGIDLEASAAGTGKFKPYMIAIIGMVLNKTGWKFGKFDPTHYRKQLSLNTDYRKIQDGLRMTLCLEHELVEKLKTFLEEKRDARHLRFGLIEQDKAVLTCFVPSFTSDDHYHFMDGAGGGYAAAAADLH